MPIYRCTGCRKFATLSPGRCWRCGQSLVPDDPSDGGGLPPPPDGGLPPGSVYRCNACRQYATLGPGFCLLCNAQLIPAPDADSAGVANRIDWYSQEVLILSRQLNALIRQLRDGNRQIFGRVRAIRSRLQEIRQALLQEQSLADEGSQGSAHSMPVLLEREEMQIASGNAGELLNGVDGCIALADRTLSHENRGGLCVLS